MRRVNPALAPVVLVGFAEAASAPEVVWSLVDAGFRVSAFARRGRASGLRRSRHIQCHDIQAPEADAHTSLSDLAGLIGSIPQRPAVFFPLDDTAIWLCSRLELPSSWQLAGPSLAMAELALDKRVQLEAALRAGFRVLPTRVVCTTRQLAEAVNSYPVFLKGAECAALRDGRLVKARTWICADAEELARAAAEWKERVPLLVQPFIAGVGEGVFGIGTADGVIAWSGHRRLRMMNPQGSGASACVSTEVSADVKIMAEALIMGSGWRGLFMLELLRDALGQLWFVELNGRPWGSIALGRHQGLEYPAWEVAFMTAPASLAGVVRCGTEGIVCRHFGRELMHLLFVLKGPKSRALQHTWPSLPRTLRALCRVGPGEHLYNWRRDDPAVFVSDCYNTVRDNVFLRKR